MPLPLDDCADDIPTDVCCPTLFGIADRIRCIATDAFYSCVDAAVCTERGFRSIVAMDPHEDFFGDILTVVLTNWGVDATSQEGSKTLPILLTVAQYRLELQELGWPVPEVDEQGELISVPPADLVNAVSRHAYSHGEAIGRALMNTAARREFWHRNIGLPTDGFSAFQVSPMSPISPQGRVVGWRWDLRVRWNPGPGIPGS